MRIESVALSNWMPFRGEQRLDSLPALPMALVARYADNPRRSNWGGKTAFLELVDWVLYGRHRKRHSDAVIHGDEDGTWGELCLTGGARVRRAYPRGGPGELHLWLPGESELCSDAAQAALLRLLRLSYEDSLATTCFSQGDVEALVARTSSERRTVFSRWLELDVWGRLSERVRAWEKRARDAHAALLAVPQEPEPRKAEEIDADRERALARVAEVHGQLLGVQAKLADYHRANEGASAETDFQRVAEEGKALRAELQRVAAPGEAELSAAVAEERESGAALGVAVAKQEEARRLVQDGFDGKCPVMRAACPVAEQVSAAGKAARQALRCADYDVSGCSGKAGEASRRVQALRAAADTRARKVQRYELLVEQGRVLKAKAEARKARLAALGDVDVAGLEAEQVRLTDELVRARTWEAELLAESKARVSYFERRAAHARRIQEEGDKARVAALAARCVGPNGVPREKAMASLGGLQATANALLQGTGLGFTLAWERETQDLSPVCYDCGHAYGSSRKLKQCPSCGTARGNKRADEVEILVDDGSGAVEDARVKSGAARALVGSALRLAGGMLLRELRGSQVAWAKVDEPFGSLDAENRAALVGAFTSMLGAVGLEQAFVVSHDAALLDKLPARLVVTRDGDSSRIELES